MKKTVALLFILSLSLTVTGFSISIKSQNATSISAFSQMPLWAKGALLINASDYVGSNDTERLQAALDDVPPEGATVLISGFWTASGLIAKSNTTILGVNGTIQRPYNTTEPFIALSNASNFAIMNLTFDGREINNGYGVNVIDGSSFVLQGNTFLKIKRSAIKASVSLDGISENFSIAENAFFNCNDAPILIFGRPSERAIHDFAILSNTMLNGLDNGKIAIAFSSNGMVENNTVANCQHGIATRCVSNLTIQGNVIRNTVGYGIYLGTQIGDNGTNNITLDRNKITEGHIGIARYYGSYSISNVVIKENQFTNNDLYDILADFPATYVNNTVTCIEKLVIQDLRASFIETRDIENNPIMPGDINSDLKIDITDIATVAIKYGCVEGSPDWDPKLDVIRNGAVDIKDVSYVSTSFGSSV
jgi:parallel beta-helix repeat protein